MVSLYQSMLCLAYKMFYAIFFALLPSFPRPAGAKAVPINDMHQLFLSELGLYFHLAHKHKLYLSGLTLFKTPVYQAS